MSDKRLIFPCGAYFPLKDDDSQWLESAHRAKDGAYRIGTHPSATPIVDEPLWDKRGWYAPPNCSDRTRRAPCLWGCPTPKRRKEERGFDEQGNLGYYVSCFARLHSQESDGNWSDITPPAPAKCPHCEEQRAYVQACKRAAKTNEDAPDRTKWRKCPQCEQYHELFEDTGRCATCQLVQVVEANRG